MLRAAGAALGVGTWPFGALSLTRWPQIRLCNPSRNSVNYLLFYKINLFSSSILFIFIFCSGFYSLCLRTLGGSTFFSPYFGERHLQSESMTPICRKKLSQGRGERADRTARALRGPEPSASPELPVVRANSFPLPSELA